MPQKLQRISIIDRAANCLKDGIADGEWTDWLPGERQLCKHLNVGRNTIRAALKALESDGWTKTIPAKGSRILRTNRSNGSTPIQIVGLLSPNPIDYLFPRQILWIDGLRERLSADGCAMRSYHGQQYFKQKPNKTLERLVIRENCGCWILVSSTQAMQSWFSAEKIPCLIAGSGHRGIDLPFVDIDYQALCRHAASQLIRIGHRHIVYLAPKPELAGDLQSEKGFLEGVGGPDPGPKTIGRILHLEPSVERTIYAVKRLMRQKEKPTALLVHNAFQYLTVYSALAQSGFSVPEHISLICRESENFLSYLDPAPTRYTHDPARFSTRLSQIIRKLMSQSAIRTRSNLLMPDFVEGGSISPIYSK